MADTIIGFTAAVEPPTVQEVCLVETFHAQCVGASVIVMLSALYGRMRPSRCAPANTGDFGCVANALEYMDGRCSGSHECSVAIPDLFNLNACGLGYISYLEASYRCVPVIDGSIYEDACNMNGVILVSGITQGVIASSVTPSRPGSGICPYTVEVEPGQRINVTLLDFGPRETSGADSGVQTACHKYATLTETSMPNPMIVCGGSVREKNVYVSQSHRLHIQLANPISGDSGTRFLLKFSALGCPDPDVNGHEVLERSPDMVALHCRQTGESLKLYCTGNNWNQPPSVCNPTFDDQFLQRWTSMKGFGLVLGIGIIFGAIIGSVCFCCIFILIRRRSVRKQPRQVVYYEGDGQWNARQNVGNNELNNGMARRSGEYNGMARRSGDYDPRSLKHPRWEHQYEHVYDPVVVEADELSSPFPGQYGDTLNRYPTATLKRNLEGNDANLR